MNAATRRLAGWSTPRRLGAFAIAAATSIAGVIALVSRPHEPERGRVERRSEVIAIEKQATALESKGLSDEAIDAYRQAIGLRGLIVMECPYSVDDRCQLARSLEHAGSLLTDAGQWEEAEDFMKRGQRLCSASSDARVVEFRPLFLRDLALLMTERGNLERAWAYLDDATKIEQTLVAQIGERHQINQKRLVVLLIDQARCLIGRGNSTLAQEKLEQALIVCNQLNSYEDTDLPVVTELHAIVCDLLADLAIQSSADFGVAGGLLEEAMEFEQTTAKNSAVDLDTERMAHLWERWSRVNEIGGKLNAAENGARDAIAFYSELREREPASAHYRFLHGRSQNNLGAILGRMKRPTEALPAVTAALGEIAAVYSQNMTDPSLRQAINIVYHSLSSLRLHSGDYRGCASAIAQHLQTDAARSGEMWQAAQLLNQCAALCGGDQTLAPADRETLKLEYQSQASAARAQAIHIGYRPHNPEPARSGSRRRGNASPHQNPPASIESKLDDKIR